MSAMGAYPAFRIDATTHRLRPIVLTSGPLGMVPIASEVFSGIMAHAIIGGLFVATLLTLLFLPALYVARYRIKDPRKERTASRSECAGRRQVGNSRLDAAWDLKSYSSLDPGYLEMPRSRGAIFVSGGRASTRSRANC
jgi:hypothetical protein